MDRMYSARFALVLLAIATASSSAGAQNGNAHDLERTDARRLELTTRVDIAGLRKILRDDLVYIRPDGSVLSKESYLAALATGKFKLKNAHHTSVQTRIFRNTGIISGVSEGIVGETGRETSVRVRYTHIYVREGRGDWQLAWVQVTNVRSEEPQNKAPN